MRVPLEDAATIILSGGVVAVPTETVYGLAASCSDRDAIKQVFALKGRPSNNPLITHINDISVLNTLVKEFPPHFKGLAEAFWPGSLTMVLPIHDNALDASITAGLKTAAFRVPDHPLAQKLIDKTGPIVMPSANLSGRPSSTEPDHIEDDFGIDFPVIDGGMCQKGIESTVLIYKDSYWEIGRLGGISAEDISKVIGYLPKHPQNTQSTAPLCPGQLYRHYAPKATLYTDKEIPSHCEVALGYTQREYAINIPTKLLGSIHSPEEVAHNLYHVLREIDRESIQHAWIDTDIPTNGLWKSIRERILKAASSK